MTADNLKFPTATIQGLSFTQSEIQVSRPFEDNHLAQAQDVCKNCVFRRGTTVNGTYVACSGVKGPQDDIEAYYQIGGTATLRTHRKGSTSSDKLADDVIAGLSGCGARPLEQTAPLKPQRPVLLIKQ